MDNDASVDCLLSMMHKEKITRPSPPPVVSIDQVHKVLRKINPCKAAGPDNIVGWALKAFTNELADVLTSIFNLSLSQSIVPTCFKTTTMIPLPKKSPPTCLNNYRGVALTAKCFERVVLAYIESNIPDTLDPPIGQHQMLALLPFTTSSPTWKLMPPTSGWYWLIAALPSILSSLTNSSTNCLHPTLCDWLQDFLTGRSTT
ncbi:uncharacterized protein LOC112847980 [Oreochromis niloticus]|uniref:uncharacterized protein LOC112847980 n=1 Tax=Oreochromis niloticus TaxID=8128 RepID=UPI000DF25F2D|nr:uncharacterized protein LOC112847980 [Oreochromis niloticus]CAI5642557.1 unnamed protein product [Mustela putorius furo]